MANAAALYLGQRCDLAAHWQRKSSNLILGALTTRNDGDKAGNSNRRREVAHIGNRNAGFADLCCPAAPDLCFEVSISLAFWNGPADGFVLLPGEVLVDRASGDRAFRQSSEEIDPRDPLVLFGDRWRCGLKGKS